MLYRLKRGFLSSGMFFYVLAGTFLVVWISACTVVEGSNRVEDIIRRMSLEEKIGQIMMVGFPGTTPVYEGEYLIRNQFVGGVILFSRNLTSIEQTAGLTNALQEIAVASGAGVPLLIAVDQEGGLVERLPGATPFPGNMALGAVGDPELARRVGQAVGNELRAVGINVNFAPVIDVNSNPKNPVIGVRSFGEDPDSVASLGVAVIEGLQSAGVIATAKHFPGHGDTSLDSHISLPTVPHSRDRLERVELYPFRRAIAAAVDAIMTAHVTFPAIESTPGIPATLSERVLTGLLRREMGFGGLIFTDAMEMKAISDRFGSIEAAKRAIQAGTDMILIAWPRDWRMAVEVAEGLIAAVRSGEIPESRIEESVRRILLLKEKRGILDNHKVNVRKAVSEVGGAGHRSLALEAARRSLTLVRNENGILPLRGKAIGRLLVITPELDAFTETVGRAEGRTRVGQWLEGNFETVKEVTMSTRPTTEEYHSLLKMADSYDVVILLTDRAWSSPYRRQGELAAAISRLGKKVIAVALREPYDLTVYPKVDAYLAVYDVSPFTAQVVAEALLGELNPEGRLPVSIPGLYPEGYGLGY